MLAEKIQEKISNNQLFYSLSIKEQIQNFETISKLSFLFAGLLTSNPEEQEKMFYTMKLTERLIILNHIIERLRNINNFSLIYNLNVPASSVNNLRNAILLILGILIFLIANKQGYFKRFSQR
eukprot:TRINITY_DN44633_c0_g1_i1.p2 TRINITY_DN44633_c0_g1~~TRINITY_DN44633_c0_g1_i1.p2  ORF type:complete len:123 (+),score=19.03 TRINITY_DN44633_c0_g1_i1:321-689(+)